MNMTILVIDDSDINMDVMLFALQALGCVAIPALNGPAGLAIAKAERPGLILCDINMPHLDGFGVLKGLRSDESIATTPIIAVTLLGSAGNGESYLAAGFDGVLGKPVHLDELKEVIRTHLSQSNVR
ncbi:MAG TPA: response regulator [Telluria sp.]|jgi:CheY-like chemotaxis protein